MHDDDLYLTTYEAALAVVATAMKKARLSLGILAVNSLMGGILFTAGGMLHVMVQSELPEVVQTNPGIVHLLQGFCYPIGLFYVVIMGVDLFNSNILYFAVGLARGAASVLDLLISWLVSWWLNLLGNIFVCYIICHYSAISSSKEWVTGSIQILDDKVDASFVQTLIKGMAGNFLVCLAVYLQIMAKPLHVKFFLMLLPIFTFVSLGFTHSVADMFMVVIGLINGAKHSVGAVAWKVLLPGAVGNIIGGTIFSLIVPWYLHIVVVERDQKKLQLPKFDMRDQQPELNMDSRVVRVKEHEDIEEEDDSGETSSSSDTNSHKSEKRRHSSSLISGRKRSILRKSPSNVFPVYGMGQPRQRERSIASGCSEEEQPHELDYSKEQRKSATFMGESVMRTLSRTRSRNDLEANSNVESDTKDRPSALRRAITNTESDHNFMGKPFKGFKRTQSAMGTNNTTVKSIAKDPRSD